MVGRLVWVGYNTLMVGGRVWVGYNTLVVGEITCSSHNFLEVGGLACVGHDNSLMVVHIRGADLITGAGGASCTEIKTQGNGF
ncbi:hypothetical protein RRG08_026912 [Elysia crispata]|uniref:Uncharacterized protein n=1 Tax=Elysia crispata TaxID=231223 RepID=A0AAE1AXB8_9GAST|nr:hypothetical protein RRG08_026912 [Elysia crispata]